MLDCVGTKILETSEILIMMVFLVVGFMVVVRRKVKAIFISFTFNNMELFNDLVLCKSGNR